MNNKAYALCHHYAMTDGNNTCVSDYSIKLFSTQQKAYEAFMKLLNDEITDWNGMIENVSIKKDHIEADIPSNYTMTSSLSPTTSVFSIYEKYNYEKNHSYISINEQPIL